MIKIVETITQNTLSKIFIDLIPSQLTKKDWKNACPHKVSWPIAPNLLPNTEPVSSIFIG